MSTQQEQYRELVQKIVKQYNVSQTEAGLAVWLYNTWLEHIDDTHDKEQPFNCVEFTYYNDNHYTKQIWIPISEIPFETAEDILDENSDTIRTIVTDLLWADIDYWVVGPETDDDEYGEVTGLKVKFKMECDDDDECILEFTTDAYFEIITDDELLVDVFKHEAWAKETVKQHLDKEPDRDLLTTAHWVLNVFIKIYDDPKIVSINEGFKFDNKDGFHFEVPVLDSKRDEYLIRFKEYLVPSCSIVDIDLQSDWEEYFNVLMLRWIKNTIYSDENAKSVEVSTDYVRGSLRGEGVYTITITINK